MIYDWFDADPSYFFLHPFDQGLLGVGGGLCFHFSSVYIRKAIYKAKPIPFFKEWRWQPLSFDENDIFHGGGCRGRDVCVSCCRHKTCCNLSCRWSHPKDLIFLYTSCQLHDISIRQGYFLPLPFLSLPPVCYSFNQRKDKASTANTHPLQLFLEFG